MERQQADDERRRRLTRPAPWFSLLHHPSRAAWRSAGDDGSADGAGGGAPLSRSALRLLRRSERTNKQLKRTHKRTTDAHAALAVRRERERRAAANVSLGKSNR